MRRWDLSTCRATLAALAARAMSRLKLGKTDACWEDLLACHRFGRLTGQGPNMIQGLVAIAIDTMACEGDQAVLQHAPLTPAQAAKMRDDLAAAAASQYGGENRHV